MENNNKQIYEEAWGEVSDMFKNNSPGNRLVFYLLNKALKKTKSIHTILDVGCGEGSKTAFLAKAIPNASVIGIDFTESAIAVAQKRYPVPNCHFVKADAEDNTFWQTKYDMVTAFEVLEHIDDWQTVLKQMSDSTTRYLMLSFPTGHMRPYEKLEGHVRNFKTGEVERYLQSCNMRAVDIYYAGFPFINPIGRDLRRIFNNVYDNNLRKAGDTILNRLYSKVFYFLFRYCSTKRILGNQFVGLFERT